MAQPANDNDLWIADAAAQLGDRTDDTDVYNRLAPKLRATVRRGVPIATDSAGIEVNTRALRFSLARIVGDVCQREIAALHFDTDGKIIQRVRLDLVGRYDDELGVLGDHVRDTVRAGLGQLLGPATGAQIAIEVRWTDLESPTS
ncbi:hypothetical protein DFR67_101382 [Williamsia limnetica]|uniref:Uncharacterized protein n=1 Tax=Williamsia limnetica TaxID=882452 RepID=A0A318S2R9_WILLI|nr:hypothetical protein [Williamsia limnetica]PYE20990.1 hypothetical protein DFR67_101382 [Williamsia limnetica]